MPNNSLAYHVTLEKMMYIDGAFFARTREIFMIANPYNEEKAKQARKLSKRFYNKDALSKELALYADKDIVMAATCTIFNNGYDPIYTKCYPSNSLSISQIMHNMIENAKAEQHFYAINSRCGIEVYEVKSMTINEIKAFKKRSENLTMDGVPESELTHIYKYIGNKILVKHMKSSKRDEDVSTEQKPVEFMENRYSKIPGCNIGSNRLDPMYFILRDIDINIPEQGIRITYYPNIEEIISAKVLDSISDIKHIDISNRFIANPKLKGAVKKNENEIRLIRIYYSINDIDDSNDLQYAKQKLYSLLKCIKRHKCGSLIQLFTIEAVSYRLYHKLVER